MQVYLALSHGEMFKSFSCVQWETSKLLRDSVQGREIMCFICGFSLFSIFFFLIKRIPLASRWRMDVTTENRMP